MFREDIAPSSREVLAFVTPGGHLGTQARGSTADATWFQDGGWAGAPIWLMLARSGNLFITYRSNDGDNWTPMTNSTATMPATIHAGLAVSSHDNPALDTGTFSNIEIVQIPLNAPSNLSASLFNGTSVRLQWTDNSATESSFYIERATGAGSGAFTMIRSVDANVTQYTDTSPQPNTTYTYRIRAVRYIDAPSDPSNTFTITTTDTPLLVGGDLGTVGVPGTFTYENGVLTIDASGEDIWGQADSGYAAVRQVSGDFDVRARITSLTNTHPWAKAGIMAREWDSPSAPNFFVLLTAENVAGMQVRASFTDGTSFTPGPWVRAPYWVRLVRSGLTFTSYLSPDGTTWQLIGTETLTLLPDMGVGIAVTSHDNTTTTRATVDSLSYSYGN